MFVGSGVSCREKVGAVLDFLLFIFRTVGDDGGGGLACFYYYFYVCFYVGGQRGKKLIHIFPRIGAEEGRKQGRETVCSSFCNYFVYCKYFVTIR